MVKGGEYIMAKKTEKVEKKEESVKKTDKYAHYDKITDDIKALDKKDNEEGVHAEKATPFHLYFDNSEKNGDSVSAVFGMKHDKFHILVNAIVKQLALGVLNGAPESRTECLQQYLRSDKFATLEWKPKTANDFFLLGMAFDMALKKIVNAQKHIKGEDILGFLSRVI